MEDNLPWLHWDTHAGRVAWARHRLAHVGIKACGVARVEFALVWTPRTSGHGWHVLRGGIRMHGVPVARAQHCARSALACSALVHGARHQTKQRARCNVQRWQGSPGSVAHCSPISTVLALRAA